MNYIFQFLKYKLFMLQFLCSGDAKLFYDRETYLSEQETADRNRSLAYMMRENKSFPPGTVSSQLIARNIFNLVRCGVGFQFMLREIYIANNSQEFGHLVIDIKFSSLLIT